MTMEMLQEQRIAGIFESISEALQLWLDSLTVLEERHKIVTDLNEAIYHTLLQIQKEGTFSIYHFSMLENVGRIWSELLEILSSTTDVDKRLIVKYLLELYDLKQLTKETFINIIIEL